MKSFRLFGKQAKAFCVLIYILGRKSYLSKRKKTVIINTKSEIDKERIYVRSRYESTGFYFIR